MCALVTGVQTCSSDLSRPPDCQRCRGEDRQTTMGGRIRMSDFTRRDVLKTTVAAAAAGAGGSLLLPQSSFAQQAPNLKIEKGAKLRVLRWSQFVQGDIDQWLANPKKFTEKTGVEVRLDRSETRRGGKTGVRTF